MWRTDQPDRGSRHPIGIRLTAAHIEASLCQEVPPILLVARDVVFLLWGSRRDRSVGSGPGGAWPKSRWWGGEPAPVPPRSRPRAPPRPPDVAAAGGLLASPVGRP